MRVIESAPIGLPSVTNTRTEICLSSSADNLQESASRAYRRAHKVAADSTMESKSRIELAAPGDEHPHRSRPAPRAPTLNEPRSPGFTTHKIHAEAAALRQRAPAAIGERNGKTTRTDNCRRGAEEKGKGTENPDWIRRIMIYQHRKMFN